MNSKVKFMISAAVIFVAMSIFASCKKNDTADARDSYVGSYRTNWELTISGQNFSGTYTLVISTSATNDKDIIMNNIDGTGESVRATVSGNAFTIPQQTIEDLGISGSGTLNGNVINFSTQETQTGGTQVNITQTATKQ